MRVLALHADVVVAVSSIWQTTCTAIRSGDEGFVIDSVVLPSELEALPGLLDQARFPVSGLIATHADWDHLLGVFAFPDVPVGCARSTALRLSTDPQNAQQELGEFDREFLIERAPLTLGAAQTLPVPGRLEIGRGPDRELELLTAEGHTADGLALYIPWTRTLVCGDYLSPHEIPTIAPGGSPAAYLQTLERLRAVLRRAETVVPGHGAPYPAEQALGILDEDAVYLQALVRLGQDARLPPTRSSAVQRRAHEQNVLQASGE